MAMADVKAAFNAGLGSAGTCIAATMGYVPENRRLQRLTFTVNVNGTVHSVTDDVPPGVDLARKAREMAEVFIAGLGD